MPDSGAIKNYYACFPHSATMVVTVTGLTIRHRDLISPLAAWHRLPARFKKVTPSRLPRIAREHYRLADEKREIILAACSKCDWRAAFSREDLIASLPQTISPRRVAAGWL